MSLKDLAKQVKKETKLNNRTFEEMFLSSLDDVILQLPAREDKVAFNPSGYYKCQRGTWYKWKGYKQSPSKRTAKGQMAMEVGTALHKWIQEEVFMSKKSPTVKLVPAEELPSFGKEGVTFVKEHRAPDMEVKFRDTRFTREIPISAMTDGILSFMGREFIYEFKSINQQGFDALIEPQRDHIKQGAIYSMCLGLPHVLFHYFCKNTQQWKAYLIEYNESHYDWVRERLLTLEEYYLNDTLPPKEDSKDCYWCQFKSQCEKEVE